MPKVSVLMIAYNIERFLSQAVDSVLMQRADFDYEIVIGEDCSTDNTRNIVQQYAAAHPAKIRAILRERNLGMNANFVATLQECRGTYIALLDGDDYWTSPYKLQRQVDFLDKHPDYSVSFHNVTIIYEDGRTPHPFYMAEPRHHLSRRPPQPTSTVAHLAGGNFIQTCSVLYRCGLFDALPEWFLNMPTYDWPLHVLNATHGKLGYLDEELGAYRVHSGGMWSMNMSRYRRIEDIESMIRAFDIINKHLNREYEQVVTASVLPLYYKAAERLYGMGRYAEALAYARKYLAGVPFRKSPDPGFLLRVMLGGYFPRIYNLLKRSRRVKA